MRNFVFSVGWVIGALILSGCSGDSLPSITTTDIEVKTNAPIEKALHFTIIKDKKSPVVFLFPGSGGSLYRPKKWSEWFIDHGISTVMIDSAKYRNADNLYKYDYSKDLSEALAVAMKQPSLDTGHYAVMGFSKGGTAALGSGEYLSENQPLPDAIFALYPGAGDYCPNTYQGKDVNISIFYGDKDQWGDWHNTRDTCREMANSCENTTFYLLKDAYHGYDGDTESQWSCCDQTFTNKPNAAALQKTKEVIAEVLGSLWNIHF